MSELQDRLQQAVGDAYRIDKELGGGGMSRVFLAEETALARQVVIKVLPPEMGAGVNRERFHREIQVSAGLQHPHIVSVLTAGDSDDLVYYIMPFIEGESLRARLAREGGMPVADVLKILREVSDALSFAHSKNIVHRDIKPDNILLSGRHALVADFGVAKAVAASSGDSTLTSLGMALGTPTYMPPEQAAADPNTDHRADLYAVGVVAYEMLSGSPPFTAPTPQAMLAAHVNETPEPVNKYRASIPAVLVELVMRCLQKHPADRWQSADELRTQLEAIATPTGGTTPHATAPIAAAAPSFSSAARANNPVRVGLLYGIVAVLLLAAWYGLTIGLGLPMWVFVGASALTLVGFPIVVTTGFVERKRIELNSTRATSAPALQSGIRGVFTWKRAIRGGVLAFALLAIVTIGFMATRVLGVGPGATLLSAGVLESDSPIIMAEFENRSADSTLGATVTEALRVDLAQSPVITLMGASHVSAALERANRSPNEGLDRALAMEIAEREGAGAVVAGEIGALGSSYVLSVSVLNAADGRELLALRETAADDSQIIEAIDRLSADLRERVGESLRTIRSSPPLARVTTGSLDALRLYSEALAAEDAGEMLRAVQLYREATSVDTTFAMAYRKIAVSVGNAGGSVRDVVAAATRAYQLRDRLPENERLHAIAYYQSNVDGGLEAAIDTYRRLLDRYPDDEIAPINMANYFLALRHYEDAERAIRILWDRGNRTVNAFWLIEGSLVGQQRFAEAESLAADNGDFVSVDPRLILIPAVIRATQGAVNEADSLMEAGASTMDAHPFWGVWADYFRTAFAATRGRMSTGVQVATRGAERAARSGIPTAQMAFTSGLGNAKLMAGDTAAAIAYMDSLLGSELFEEADPMDRGYPTFVSFYARAGEPERAESMWNDFVNGVPESVRNLNAFTFQASGDLAYARGDYRAALQDYTTFFDMSGFCGMCGAIEMGRAYQALGLTDSAITAYGNTKLTGLFPNVSLDKGQGLYRLGQLYEQTGNTELAIDNYDRFVSLWENADAVLQPFVSDARERLAELSGEGR